MIKKIIFSSLLSICSFASSAQFMADYNYELKLTSTHAVIDNGLLYTLPNFKFELYEFEESAAIEEDVFQSIKSLLIPTDSEDILFVANHDNNLNATFSIKNGFFNSADTQTTLSTIIENMVVATERCIGTLNEEGISAFEDYVFNPRSLDNLEDETPQHPTTLANILHNNYINNLCRENNDSSYTMNDTVKSFLTHHIEVILSGSERNLVPFGSDLTSLSQVFKNLYLSENSGIYIRVMIADFIDRYKNSDDSRDQLENHSEIYTKEYLSYVDFILDESITSDFKKETLKKCDELSQCNLFVEDAFSISQCINLPKTIEISGYETTKIILHAAN